jgi:hypothetical protein
MLLTEMTIMQHRQKNGPEAGLPGRFFVQKSLASRG